MKKIILSIVILFVAFYSNAQTIKISELPTSSGNHDSLWLPVVDGGSTKKVRGYKLYPKFNLPLVKTTDTIKIAKADASNDGYLAVADFNLFNNKWDPSGNTFASNPTFGTISNHSILFVQNNIERMRLTSTGLGIGNTPVYPLDVTGIIRGTGDAYINGMTIGKGAGNVIDNTVMGYQALNTNISSNQNVAIGYQASSSSGGTGNNAFQNVFIGHQTAYQLQKGNDNVAIGAYSMWYTIGGTSCDYNTAIGKTSLGHVTGGNNVGIGKHSGILITSGGSNTIIGTDAAGTLTTGSSNIIIGASAAVSAAGISNELNIGGWLKGTNGKIGINVLPTTDYLEINGNLSLLTAGNKLKIATGSNASIGQSGAMTAGSITISTTAVTSSSIIMLVHATVGGTQGILSVGTIVNGTSFVINSSSATDTGTVNWWIIN